MPKEHLIFDFDGTLADSLPLLIALFYEITKSEQQFSAAEIERLRNMPAQRVIKELGVPLYRVPRLLIHGRNQLTKHIDDLAAIDGIVPVVKKLHKKGFKLYIVSSNSTHNIQLFLDRYGIGAYFEHIYGGVGIFGKASALKSVMKREKLDRGSCVYIGDETRDIEAARKAGVAAISVSWGFNGKQILQEYQPDALVDLPGDLLKATEAVQ